MSKWLTGRELMERLDIREFELFEHIKEGLQPYDAAGIPIDVPQAERLIKGSFTMLQWKAHGLNVAPNSTKWIDVMCAWLFKETDVVQLEKPNQERSDDEPDAAPLAAAGPPSSGDSLSAAVMENDEKLQFTRHGLQASQMEKDFLVERGYLSPEGDQNDAPNIEAEAKRVAQKKRIKPPSDRDLQVFRLYCVVGTKQEDIAVTMTAQTGGHWYQSKVSRSLTKVARFFEETGIYPDMLEMYRQKASMIHLGQDEIGRDKIDMLPPEERRLTTPRSGRKKTH